MLPRALTMWPQGQLERIVIVLVAVGGWGVLEEPFNLRFAISVVTIWGEATLRTHTHTHTHTVCKPTPPNSTACQQSPHTSAHFAFFILYNYSSNTPKGKVTHVRTHISSSTWLNVTVGHVLICWRYRVNDGHVVTFTQARESMQPLPGAEGDGKP